MVLSPNFINYYEVVVVSFWGFVPRPPLGLHPWIPLGDFSPQTEKFARPPEKIPGYVTEWYYSQAGSM